MKKITFAENKLKKIILKCIIELKIVGIGAIREIAVPFSQSCCKPKTALKK